MKAKKLLSILLSFVLILGCIPMAMAADVPTLEVVSETKDVSAGDVVTYEVWLRDASLFADGVWNVTFALSIPEGMELVAGSGAADANFATATAFINPSFTESSLMFTSMGAMMAGYKGDDLVCMSFQCKVLESATTDLTVSVAETDLSDGANSIEANVVSHTVGMHVHAFGEDWKGDKENHWHECSCGNKDGVAAHTVVVVPGYAATCSKDGLTDGAVCTVCGVYTIEQDTIAATGEHTWVAGDVITEATCTTEGEQEFICSVCGETKIETVKAHGHTTEVVPAVDATCKDTGLTEGERCTICGVYTVEQDVVPTTGIHNYVAQDNGDVIVYTCSVCGHSYEEVKDSNVEIEVAPDGSVTTTTKNEDGTTTVETKKPGGLTVTETIDAEGNVTSTTVTISKAAAEKGEVITLPIAPVTVTKDSSAATTITINTNSEVAVPVEVPVAAVTPGSVIVIVMPDGTEMVVSSTKMTENGLLFNCPDGAVIKVVDKSVDFVDVNEDNWFKDAVDYVSARGIMNGMGNNEFGQAGATTRAQVWTMLARMAGAEVDGTGATPWYAAAQEWAMSVGITDGDRPNDEISRQELVTMLHRYVTKIMGITNGKSESIEGFSDADLVSDWAQEALEWAKGEGVMNGNADGTLNPTGDTARRELAQFFMNFMQNF